MEEQQKDNDLTQKFQEQKTAETQPFPVNSHYTSLEENVKREASSLEKGDHLPRAGEVKQNIGGRNFGAGSTMESLVRAPIDNPEPITNAMDTNKDWRELERRRMK